MPRARDMKSGLDISSVGRTSTKLSSAPAPTGDAVLSTRTRAIFALIAAAVIALAIAVGVLVYQVTVRNALAYPLDDAELASVLADDSDAASDDDSEDAAADDDDAADDDASDGTWSVVVQTDSPSAEKGRGTLTGMALVFASPSAQAVSLVYFDADLRVYLAGHGYKTLAEAFDLEGTSGIVSVASGLVDSGISHYFEANALGLSRVQSELSLDTDGTDAASDEVASAFLSLLADSTADAAGSIASALDLCVSSDMDEGGLSALFSDLLSTEDSLSCWQADVPTSREKQLGETSTVVDSESWANMVSRVTSGLSPVAGKGEIAANRRLRDSQTVTVWNGVGVSGVAADCTDELTSLGWDVEVTGNAAQYVYDETFIIYKYDEDADAATLLQDDLGQGRIVRSAARYSYDTTLLVVIGSDYQPY